VTVAMLPDKAAPAQGAAAGRRFGLGARALDITHMTLPQILQVCEILAEAGEAIPRSYRGKRAAIFAAVMHGASLGLQPMAALQGITIVDGSPTLSAALLGALVIDAGHALRVEYDDTRAVATLTRGDSGESTSVAWDLERAQRAGLCHLRDDGRPWARSSLGKPLPWELYPGAMLRSRAVAEVCRAAAPDVLFGLGVQYVTEELGVVVDQDGLPVGGEIERYPEPQQIAAQALADRAQAASSRSEVEAIAGEMQQRELATLVVTVEGVRGALRSYLNARWKALPPEQDSAEDQAAADAVAGPVPEWEGALLDLYDAAQAAGYASPEHAATEFAQQHGHPLEEAGTEELRAFTAVLRAAAPTADGEGAEDDGQEEPAGQNPAAADEAVQGGPE
jgi:hypothetical protein